MLIKSLAIALVASTLTLIGPAATAGTKASTKGSTVLVCPRGALPQDCFKVKVR